MVSHTTLGGGGLPVHTSASPPQRLKLRRRMDDGAERLIVSRGAEKNGRPARSFGYLSRMVYFHKPNSENVFRDDGPAMAEAEMVVGR